MTSTHKRTKLVQALNPSSFYQLLNKHDLFSPSSPQTPRPTHNPQSYPLPSNWFFSHHISFCYSSSFVLSFFFYWNVSSRKLFILNQFLQSYSLQNNNFDPLPSRLAFHLPLFLEHRPSLISSRSLGFISHNFGKTLKDVSVLNS